jgi:hypothetical protein
MPTRVGVYHHPTFIEGLRRSAEVPVRPRGIAAGQCSCIQCKGHPTGHGEFATPELCGDLTRASQIAPSQAQPSKRVQ